MKFEYLIPVGTLILGWVLNELSRGLNTVGKRKRVMLQAVYQFFLHLDDLRMSLHFLKETPKLAKKLGSIEKAEALRVNAYESNSEEMRKRKEALISLAKEVSAFDPVLGYDLYSFLPDVDEMNVLILGKTPETYSKALAMRGGFVCYYIDKMESLCRRLAWRCSFVSYIRVCFQLRFLRTRMDSFKVFGEKLDETFLPRNDLKTRPNQ